MTPAHVQHETLRLAFYFPEHPPRSEDSHYHLFEHARKRILAAGVGCWICGTKEHLELHHQEVEFAAAAGVDVEKFAALFPEYHITDEEAFLCWVESDGNLRVLCADCHRSPYRGIHSCPEPQWKLQRYWLKNLPSPVQPADSARSSEPANVRPDSDTEPGSLCGCPPCLHCDDEPLPPA